MTELHSSLSIQDSDIAIIGMSCRFPGAKDIEAFWQNLRDGVESISFFSDEELSGIATLSQPNYVKAGAVLSDIELFDAAFFDFNPREAELTEPQHRIFLECAWEALEGAGYVAQTDEIPIGVYAGTGMNTYLLNNLYPNRDSSDLGGVFSLVIGNDKDFLPTRVSYKLNLKGPSVNVQTACSTSLVAVHLACQSLLNGECDLALAGAISVRVPHKVGYLYQEGMILSPDGHCRAFDAKAKGTVAGNGVGIVVLKRLEEAMADGDCIHAIIKGSAINNDGSLKIGYTAPSVEGQAAVISEAQAIAGIEADTITYIEAHGTGTELGDPIEIAALTKAFRATTEKNGFCAIGSVKTNFGHTDAAAGVAALIKTVLALKHRLLPPSLHFEQANPQIDFAKSPFYVNTTLSEWKIEGTPRRAGVSSFGIGGTNAHVILEEAPTQAPSGSTSRPWQLLVISAKTPSALETATARLARYLDQHQDVKFADVAYTLSQARRAFKHRRMLVCQNLEEARTELGSTGDAQEQRTVVFMFSGQGAQYVNMALELYQHEPSFREQVDFCSEYLKPHLGLDLRQVLYEQSSEASQQLNQTAITQAALFVIEYALAKLWMAWGVYPEAMIGHSIGEYVAACLSGVFSLEEALSLVAIRGQLMQKMPQGTMLAVPLPVEKVQSLLGKGLSVAAINTPNLCVVSGITEAVDRLEKQLGVECQRLHTSHAFHSEMMEPVLSSFTEAAKKINFRSPQIPYLSNVTGTWISAAEAIDPSYWAKHLRQTVRFAEGMQELLKKSTRILLEVGPGRTLATLARRHSDKAADQVVLTSLRHPQEKQSDIAFLLKTMGKFWLAGGKVDWSGFYAHERRHRVPLPTYPFERQRYWIEAKTPVFEKEPRSITALLDWKSIVEAGHRVAQKDVDKFDNPTYLEKRLWLNRLCGAYVNMALRGLGAFSDPTQQYSLEDFFRQFHILPFYRQMFPRCLNALVEQGQLRRQYDKYTHLIPFSRNDLKALLEDARARWPEQMNEGIGLVQLCGENFAGILTGQKNPRELLFTGQGFENLQKTYQNSPESRYYNAIVQTIIQQVAKDLPPAANLRILEIGAGTGATTTYLLPKLPPQKTHYVFTDIGPSFLSQAKQKFSEYPYLEYRVLDVDRNPNEQGYESHSFDVVIAVQVLHATKNLGKTLEHVRSLLAPFGFLLLGEATQPENLSFDVTFPLLQPFEDEDQLRSQHPFLTTEQWDDALRKYGFVEVEYFPKTQALGGHILVAKADSSFVSHVPQRQVHSRSALSQTYIAPRNQLEQTLADIWQKFLGIEKIGIHDDFFELGGDSLLAVQLVANLRETFQTYFSAHSLLNAPTIVALAEIISETMPELSKQPALQALPSSLVEINAGNRLKKPLFLIHPAGGHVYFYRDLADHLGSQQPVYGIQAQGLEGETEPLSQVEEMATHYIKVMRVRQPEGPYCLGGSSFGGTVAFEMAQQLHALGQKVALLAMIDTPGPGQMPKKLVSDTEIIVYMLNVGANLSVSLDELRKLSYDEQVRYLMEEKRRLKNPLLPDFDLIQFRHYFDLFKKNAQAMWDYQPRVYSGKIIFFRAEEKDAYNAKNPELAWLNLAAGGLEVIDVPGNHITMNEPPHVQVIAKRLEKYLDS